MIYTIVRKDSADKVDAVISFDSILSVDEAWSATVTSQTVEYGFNISDNINIEAPTYSITATISSYSLFNLDKEIVWNGEDFTSSSQSDEKSHILVRDEIIRILKERSIVSLIESDLNSDNTDLETKYTELKSGYYREIDTCVITSLSISHPDQGTGAFSVSMTLQQINLAKIDISELEEDEKRALLRPLAKTYEPNSSKTKKEDGYIDPETGLPDESAPPSSSSGDYDKMRKYYEDKLGIAKTKEQIAATEKATNYMERTGEAASVVERAGTPTAIKGFNESALIIQGGIIQ